MHPTILAMMIFAALVTGVLTVGLVLRDLRRVPAAANAPRRLRRIAAPEAGVAASGPAAGVDRWFVPLVRDAMPEWNPTATALLVVLVGLMCGGLLFFFDERLGPALVAGLLGMALPVLVLSFRRARRLAVLQDQLPPALEALARGIRSGRTLEGAMLVLGQQSNGPLAKEFRWCASQMQMGLGLPAVMRALVQRVNLYDVRVMAAALNVHRQAGGNIIELLDRLAHVVRERLNYRRQIRALTAAGRMSAGLIAIVGPAVFTYFFFFQPDYAMRMVQTSLGQLLLVIAGVLEVTGLVWISRLLRPVY